MKKFFVFFLAIVLCTVAVGCSVEEEHGTLDINHSDYSLSEKSSTELVNSVANASNDESNIADINQSNPIPSRANDENVVWGGGVENDIAPIKWHGKTVPREIPGVWEEFGSDAIAAIAARPSPRSDFVYNGKTIGEYDERFDEILNLIDEYVILLFVKNTLEYYGDKPTVLKEKLEEFRSKYNNDFSDDLWNKYYVDGRFLIEQAEADYDALLTERDEILELWEKAQNAGADYCVDEQVKIFTENNIEFAIRYHSGLSAKYFVVFATEQEFIDMEFFNEASWEFHLEDGGAWLENA